MFEAPSRLALPEAEMYLTIALVDEISPSAVSRTIAGQPSILALV